MKLGIIGLGRRMSGLLNIFLQEEPDLKVAGIVDARPDTARDRLPDKLRESVPFFDSLEALLETGPDALTIGTRCDSHARIAGQAARTGLPLFIEKPVATTLPDAIALEEAFRNSRSRTLVSFPLRASPLCRRTRALLERGDLGRMEHLMAVNYVSYGKVYFDTWYRDYKTTQGLFLQKATHDFDYLAYLAGSPIVRTAAMSSVGRVYRDSKTKGDAPDPDALYFDDIGTPETGMNEDSSSALLEFADGTKGVYTQLFYAQKTPRRGVTLSGSRALVEFDWYENKIRVIRRDTPFSDVSTADDCDNHFGGDVVLARNFLAVVRGTEESIAPIGDGLASVYACLAARESAETGRFIDVRQVDLP